MFVTRYPGDPLLLDKMDASPKALAGISGPESMAKPADASNAGASSSTTQVTDAAASTPGPEKPKKKRHRAGKAVRKKRRQSFVAPSEGEPETSERPSLLETSRMSAQQSSFYRLQQGGRSNTSLESEALLDHRDEAPHRARRQSIQRFARPSVPFARPRPSMSQQSPSVPKSKLSYGPDHPISEEDDAQNATDKTPLLGSSTQNRSTPNIRRSNSGLNYGSHSQNRIRRTSTGSKASSRKRSGRVDVANHNFNTTVEDDEDYDVNNPPSVPGSPKVGSLDDVMANMGDSHSSGRGRDAIINIDDDDFGNANRRLSSSSPEAAMRRRATVAGLAERDVCFPGDVALSEISEHEDNCEHHSEHGSGRLRRKHTRQWPDLDILDEFSREEKEERTQQEYIRAKKISEPVMVGGRLRPGKTVWHRQEDDAPFRFTYFSELMDDTIHARNISDLLQEGSTFQDLFLPEPVELSDNSDDDDTEVDPENSLQRPNLSHALNGKLGVTNHHSPPSITGDDPNTRSPSHSKSGTGSTTPSGPPGLSSQSATPRPPKARASKRYGARPTFWLDVLSPTDTEMKVLAKTFGIHQLTIEDILMEEPREKVELFQNYYFVNYRSFEQDTSSEDYMEAINLYVVVFRDGVITFHHSMTPHPANVRRRIRQLNDYMSPTADWISYAIIDDVTDAYAPLVSHIEEEVDQIDDDILYMHQSEVDAGLPTEQQMVAKRRQQQAYSSEKETVVQKMETEKPGGESGGDMLRHVGECRKKVMGLYRLLGTKADVIKGFAKRCNEHWEVAPRSEIGLYLGDIQDHIVTMTANLSHYEKYTPSSLYLEYTC